MNALARIFSYLFHPLLMLTYLIALLSFYLPAALYPISTDSIFQFLVIIFLMTFVLPLLGISFFRIFGTVSSFEMKNRNERILPFLFTTFLYVAVTYLFYSRTRIGVDDNLLKILLIVDCLVALSTLITLFYKVSVHSLAICGILGIVLPLNKISENNFLLIPTLGLIVISGIVMSSRLQLNAHTPREVLVGSVVGLSTGLFGMLYLF